MTTINEVPAGPWTRDHPCEMSLSAPGEEPYRACGATPTIGHNGLYRYCARHMQICEDAGATTLVYDREDRS